MTPDLALKSILLKTINLPEEFSECFQLYIIPKEDVDFVKNQLTSDVPDMEMHMDTLIRLFIAFFAESLPQQITFNLKSNSAAFKNDKSQEYLLAVAGILHEAKIILNDHSELFLPYVLAYDEFTKLSKSEADQPNEQSLFTKFVSNVETAIQAVIKI